MNYNIDHIISGLFGSAMIFVIIILLLFLPLIIVGIVASWKLFEKAGKKGWYSLIPIYSSWVLVEIAGLNWWWFLLLTINVIFSFDTGDLTFAINICGFLASFNCYYNIAKKFGKDNTLAVFAGIFNFIFELIFGLSKSEVYDVNIPVSKNGIFGKPEENTYNNASNGSPHSLNDGTNSENCEKHSTGESNKEKVIFCGNCGTKFATDDKFCHNCGQERL